MTSQSKFDAELVASIATEANEQGRGIQVAVSEQMAVSISTAARYISAAREMGVLPSKEQMHAAIRNPKAAAIADELGVPYEALVAAVTRHAGGDLRLLGGRHKEGSDG